MNRTEVKSSQVKSVGYDAEKQILEIEFLNRKEPDKSGPIYHYTSFSPTDWTEFRKQESIGAYLNRYIKPNFPCYRVPDVPPEAEPDVQETTKTEAPGAESE